MKNYRSNLELTNAYANYLTYSGKAKNMHFRGATIYSYGEHFPIATRCDGVTFFNGDSYSNTTAKHKALVRSAISKDNVVECMYVPQGVEIERNWLKDVHANNLNYWARRIDNLTAEIANPRTRNKATRENEIAKLQGYRKAYKKYFNI